MTTRISRGALACALLATTCLAAPALAQTVRSALMPRNRNALAALMLALAGALPAAPATAGQTQYEYDARGRLVRVSQSGGADYEARYAYDKADNRVSYTVTGASAGLVVVPKAGGGYTVILLGR